MFGRVWLLCGWLQPIVRAADVYPVVLKLWQVVGKEGAVPGFGLHQTMPVDAWADTLQEEEESLHMW